jgi:hypothetical protein
MPKYVIERGIPGLGGMSEEELRNVAEKSCDVLRDLGGDVQWVQSYATGDKLFCVYIAPNEERVREHAHRGGFPADAVLQVNTIIDPTTAETPARAEVA